MVIHIHTEQKHMVTHSIYTMALREIEKEKMKKKKKEGEGKSSLGHNKSPAS